ncbi:MAG: tudor domain-containing protein [Tepidisphaeraceae bacterium]
MDVGSAVEVREGDVWSKATIVKKEGRRTQVKYEDGTEEWVTADRMRAVGAAPEANDAKPAAADKPAPKPEVFKVNQAIEYKDGDEWKAGTVKNRDGDLYLIIPDKWESQFWWRWTTDDCVRTIGSSKQGPDREDQISVTLHNDPPVKALNDLKKKLPAYRQRMAAKAKAEANGEKASGREAFEYPVSPADTAGMKRIVLSDTAWSYKPAAAPATRPIAPNVAIDLEGGTNETFENVVAFDVRPPFALVTYKMDFGDNKQITSEVVNIPSNRVVFRGLVPFATIPAGVTSDGKTLIGKANGFHGGTKARADVWQVDGKELKHVLSFAPYAKADSKDIESVLLADDTHMITANNSGLVACWDFARAKGLWQIDVERNPTMAMLPDGKTLAIVAGGGVSLVDVATGKVLGTLDNAPSGGTQNLGQPGRLDAERPLAQRAVDLGPRHRESQSEHRLFGGRAVVLARAADQRPRLGRADGL